MPLVSQLGSGSVRWLGAALLPLTLGMSFAAGADVSPKTVLLDSPESTQQLLVSEPAAGRTLDFTRQAKYRSEDATVATVDELGLIQPIRDGKTVVVIEHGGQTMRVPVEVAGVNEPQPISFPRDVIPILTKAGCNTGGCHGKAEGQNGFKLSVFGFDPQSDHEAIAEQARGRRLFMSAPDRSLLLLKGTATAPHGGGQRMEVDSLRYRRLLRWIEEGAQYVADDSPEIVRIEVEPAEQILLARESRQLRVWTIDAAGTRRCVTTEAEYESNAGVIAGVDGRGFVQASEIPGEAAILARYLGHVTVCRVTIPRPGVTFARPPETNFIDKLAWDKLQRLGIEPSGLCDDATFLRRAYLDVIGTLPTADEARAFLADKSADKRARLVDHLLDRPEYAHYWTMRFSDLLRVDQTKITPSGAVAMTRWLRRQFAENRPYDAMTRELLTVTGNTAAEGPAGYYKALDTPELLARSVSQVFLGVRIECAQCHHHPSDRWGQEDYFAMAGLFSGITRKKLPGGGEALVPGLAKDLKHPRKPDLIPAKPLGAEPVAFGAYDDRRVHLAEWMTADKNQFFAPMIANRLWAHYFGRGLVEPIDDLRITNPATNEPLLAALATHMREVRYDLKAFTRTLLASRLYQLSPETTASNATDDQNFSHAAHKALPAEVLLDAISQATGVPEQFEGWPLGQRAIQIWDNKLPSYFFRIFGRPVRATVCECERSGEPSIAQALHLMNSPEIMEKIRSREGTAARLAASPANPEQLVDELCLVALARLPTADEKSLLLAAFASSDRRQAAEDCLWALLNSKEFLYNH
ncbi:MAG: DUF1549 and DUF1553 domain-containing protein [Pirellulaceae bacterium]|nr:DUF1549 and DUF1553 domain-containing protein [Pirellulaceae bacterium]